MKNNKLFALMGLICALTFTSSFAHEIVLEINPEKTEQCFFKAGLVSFIGAWFKNVSEDQIVLRKGTHVLKKKIKQNVKKNEICEYPISALRRFKNLGKDARLVIKKYDGKKGTSSDLKISDDVAQRLLFFLTRDTQDRNLDCSDFCKYICDNGGLFFDGIKQRLFCFDELFQLVEDEKSLSVGDVVAFFKKNKDSGELSLVHWAFVLEQGLFISKMGSGNPIFVHDLKAMLKLYKYEYIYKLGFF